MAEHNPSRTGALAVRAVRIFRTVDVLAQLNCGSSLFDKKRWSNICANLNTPEFSEENERFCMGDVSCQFADQSMRSLGYRVPLAHWDVAVGVIASLAPRWSCATRQQSNDLRARIIRIRCSGSWRVLEHLSRPSDLPAGSEALYYHDASQPPHCPGGVKYLAECRSSRAGGRSVG